MIWFVATLFGAFVGGAKGVLVMLALPGVFGATWAWPVTCVVFPLVALFVRGSARTPSAVRRDRRRCRCGDGLRLDRIGPQAIAGGDHRLLVGGAVGCLAVGAIFGFALWRIDVIMARPAPAAPPT